MIKLEIDFDVIDKTYEVRGQHNVRRWLRLNKSYDAAAILVPIVHGILAIKGVQTPESALTSSLTFLGSAGAFWVGLDLIHSLSLTRRYGIDYKQRAYAELILFSVLLLELGINISPDQMMDAEIYKKKYKLAMDGKAGIIRERYFEVPFTDNAGVDNITSVKEEHLLGSKKYVLSLDKPAEQTEYKFAYNM